MAVNYGKKFEEKFKADFSTIEGASIDRLYDVMSGYKTISQVADFLAYIFPNIYYLECKSHKGASIPIQNITQYEKLKNKVGIHGVRAGVILWLIDKEMILYIPIATITQMLKDGEKSIGIRHLGKYNIKIIPTVKKRVFLTGDYSVLKQLKEGE